MRLAEEMLNNSDLEFVTFAAGKQSFCIEITQIREIRRWAPVTVLPHSPDYVLGIMNLRGAVIPIFDLAARLGFGQIVPSERNVIIITVISDQTIGLLVDSVSEILSIPHDSVQDTPNIQHDEITQCISGVISIGGGMTRVVDLSAIVKTEDLASK